MRDFRKKNASDVLPNILSGPGIAAHSKREIAENISYDLPIDDLLARIKRIEQRSIEVITNVMTLAQDSHVSVEALYENEEVRLNHLALQLSANIQGRVAPFFRYRIVAASRDGIWKLIDYGANPNQSISEIQFFRDMLLVDTHWLLCRRVEGSKEPYRRRISIGFDKGYFVLTGIEGEIDWKGISDFVRSPYITGSRVKNFGMTYLEQVQCSILENTQNRDYKFWVFYDKTVNQLIAALEPVINRSYRRGKIEPMEELISKWQLLSLAGGSPTEAAKLEMLRLGLAVTRQTKEFRKLRDAFANRKRWFLSAARLELPNFDPIKIVTSPETPRRSSIPMPGSRSN